MWIKITNRQGSEVWINLAQAAYIYDLPDQMNIYFPGFHPESETDEMDRETTTDPRSIAEIRAALEGRR